MDPRTANLGKLLKEDAGTRGRTNRSLDHRFGPDLKKRDAGSTDRRFGLNFKKGMQGSTDGRNGPNFKRE